LSRNPCSILASSLRMMTRSRPTAAIPGGGLVCAAEAERVREIVPWFEADPDSRERRRGAGSSRAGTSSPWGRWRALRQPEPAADGGGGVPDTGSSRWAIRSASRAARRSPDGRTRAGPHAAAAAARAPRRRSAVCRSDGGDAPTAAEGVLPIAHDRVSTCARCTRIWWGAPGASVTCSRSVCAKRRGHSHMRDRVASPRERRHAACHPWMARDRRLDVTGLFRKWPRRAPRTRARPRARSIMRVRRRCARFGLRDEQQTEVSRSRRAPSRPPFGGTLCEARARSTSTVTSVSSQ